MPMMTAQTLGPLPAGAVLATSFVVGRAADWAAAAEKLNSEDADWATSPVGLETTGVGSVAAAAAVGASPDPGAGETADGRPAAGWTATAGDAELAVQPLAAIAVSTMPAAHDPMLPSSRISPLSTIRVI